MWIGTRVFLDAGVAYVFETLSPTGPAIWLYGPGDESGTDIGPLISQNADGGFASNPSLVYTPLVTGYYYLRIAYFFNAPKTDQPLELTYRLSIAVPELLFQTDVDDTYQAYLAERDEHLREVINQGGDTSTRAKALASRILVLTARIHVELSVNEDDTKRAVHNLHEALTTGVDTLYKEHLGQLTSRDAGTFIQDLKHLLIGGGFTAFIADSKRLHSVLRDNIHVATQLFEGQNDLITGYLSDIIDHFEELQRLSADFALSFVVNERSFSMDRNDVADLDDFLEQAEDAVNTLDEAGSLLQDLWEKNNRVPEFMSTLRTAISHLRDANAVIQTLLNEGVFAPLDIDQDVFTAVDDILSEINTSLEGEIYDLGRDDKTIRPLALIENLPDKREDIFLDFYRIAPEERFAYTFGGLFPQGLPAVTVEDLKEDMIVNSSDGESALKSRLTALENAFLSRIEPVPGVEADDPDAHMGLAAVKTYRLIDAHFDEIENAINYIAEGDPVRMIDELLSINTADFRTTADSIRDHFEIALDEARLVFVLLIKTNQDPQEPYAINNDDDFVPIVLISPEAEEVASIIDDLGDVRDEIADLIQDVADEIDSIMDTYLDPNLVDFTDTQSALEVVDMLRDANPTFLQLTDEGKDRLVDMRIDIEEGLVEYAGYIHDLRVLTNALSEVEDKLGIDGAVVWNTMTFADSLAQRIRDDFVYPDSTIHIEAEAVNLSAWFDTPPENLLLALRGFIDKDDTTDNTLGGLFPDRGVGSTSVSQPFVIPSSFFVEPPYPNPARASVTLTYGIPQKSEVQIRLYDMLGRQINTSYNQYQPAGKHRVALNLGEIPSGVYFIYLQIENAQKAQRLVVIK